MPLIFNSWFPAGGQFGFYDQYDAQGTFGLSPVPSSVPGAMELVGDPIGQRGTVGKITVRTTDPVDSSGAKRIELQPLFSGNADPITDWGGADANSRRWYRFAFLVTEWPRETVFTSAQFTVPWQVHEKGDTSPADVAVEPPLWLKDNGRGQWELWNTYDVNTATALATRVNQLVARIPVRPMAWEEFVIYIKWSWTNGFLYVWHNGRQIASYADRPTTFNNAVARGGSKNYSKVGVYQKTSAFDRTIYHCGTQIGDQDYTTFNAFMAACGSSDTELEGFVTRGVSL